MSPFTTIDFPAPRFRPPPKRKGVVIGCRWTPGHRVMRDDSAGTYAEVNSTMRSDTERLVQQAILLARQMRLIPTRPSVWQRIVRRLRGGKR